MCCTNQESQDSKFSESWDSSSVSTELTLDVLEEERMIDCEKNITAANQWNPNDSDYSLDLRLLGLRASTDKETESEHETLLTSSSSSFETIGEDEPIQVSKSSKKKVSFYKKVKMIRVKVDTIPEEVAEDIWYNDDDFREMKKDCIRTIRIMLNCNILDDGDEVCFRGLEFKCGPLKRKREVRKEEFCDVITEAYHRLRTGDKTIDENLIAMLSMEYSAESVQDAIEAAERDQYQDYDDWRIHYPLERILPKKKESSKVVNKKGILRMPKVKVGKLSIQLKSRVRY